MNQGPWGAPPPRNGPRLGLFLWLAAAIALLVALLALSRFFPDGLSTLSSPDAIYLIAWLALLSTSLLAVRQMNVKQTVRNILLWLGVGCVLLLGFVYQDVFFDMGQRLRSALIPGQ